MDLIVNADDFGLTAAVNRGIVAAHRDGIVTSTSLLATGAAFDDAVRLARATPTLAIGVHLALTGQRPLVPPERVRSLVDGDGKFPGDVFRLAARLLRHGLVPSELEFELDAQIRRVRESGLTISHLDGHQHVHVLPGVAPIVAALARAHGIGRVRYPAEAVRGYMLRDLRHARRLAEQLVLRQVCAKSSLYALRRADTFAGFHSCGRLDEMNLLTLLRHLPDHGRVELMCHPGTDDHAGTFGHWRYAWSRELAALRSARAREWISAQRINLVS
jgi:hopanoid biosynthesis associated protein HpnK